MSLWLQSWEGGSGSSLFRLTSMVNGIMGLGLSELNKTFFYQLGWKCKTKPSILRLGCWVYVKSGWVGRLNGLVVSTYLLFWFRTCNYQFGSGIATYDKMHDLVIYFCFSMVPKYADLGTGSSYPLMGQCLYQCDSPW